MASKLVGMALLRIEKRIRKEFTTQIPSADCLVEISK
jgi:hypothetical protein